jgi:hypothetical protein
MKKLLTFSLAVFIVSMTFGQNYWIGGASGDWNTAGNWSLGVPAAGSWVMFNNGITVDVYNVPWHNSQPTWSGAPGNTLFDLGYLYIVKSGGQGQGAPTTVNLHGGTGWPLAIVPGNVELRFSGVPGATGEPTKTFYIEAGCKLDLTNADGQKVAIALAPGSYGQIDAGSQFLNGSPFEFHHATIDPNFTVHAFKLESDCPIEGAPKNVAFKQLDNNKIDNAFVQISLCSKDQWHFYSPPVDPSVLCCTFKTDFVFQYDNIGKAWVRVPDPMPYVTTIGKGYEVYDPSYYNGLPVVDPPIWQCDCPPQPGAQYSSYHVFNGTLNNYRERQSWTLDGGGPNGSGWELIGNPYADAIKIPYSPGWTGVHSASPNPHTLGLPGHPVNWYWESTMNPHFQMWNHLIGNYTYWDFRVLPATALGYPEGQDPQIIPAMQGFFVERNDIASLGSNNLEVGQLAQMDHTYTNIVKEEGVVENFLKLRVSGNERADEMGVIFIENAAAGYDGNDGRKLFGSAEAPQLYSVTSDNENVTFNMLPLGNNSVPVNLQVGADGNYSINADFVSSFSPNAEIVLTDKQENVSQDLRINPVYNFTAKVDDDSNRFMLFFSKLLAVNNVAENVSLVWAVGSDVFVQMKDQNNNGSVMVYDMTGKKVMEKNLDNGIMTRLKTNLVNGIYVVSIVANEGSYNQKVFVNNR